MTDAQLRTGYAHIVFEYAVSMRDECSLEDGLSTIDEESDKVNRRLGREILGDSLVRCMRKGLKRCQP